MTRWFSISQIFSLFHAIALIIRGANFDRISQNLPVIALLPLNQIIEGDCLEQMRLLPDNSINLILTDPPYFNVKGSASKKYEWWDRQWDDAQGFIDWIKKLTIEWKRLLKPNGSLYCFASTKMSARVECAIAEQFNVLNSIRWRKDAGFHKGSNKEGLRGYFPQTEAVIFAEHYGADNMAKGEAGYQAKCDELNGLVFEPLRHYLDDERSRSGVALSRIKQWFSSQGLPKESVVRHSFSTSQWSMPTPENYAHLRECLRSLSGQADILTTPYEELRQQYEELRRPFSVSVAVPYTDVWDYDPIQTYPGKHPCEKPPAMMADIIRASSREGDVVLDCFAGSGSALKAASQLSRNFVGVELDPHWVAVARANVGQVSGFVSERSRKEWLQTITPEVVETGPKQLSFI